MNLQTIIGRPQVLGWELRTAIEQALPRITQALAINPVSVFWAPGATTASIGQYGDIRLPMVSDDAVIGRSMVTRYVGYIVHELLHRKYTDFNVNAPNEYLARFHNAVEDVWIERRAVSAALLGNIENLLSGLVDGIVGEALAQTIDWTNPAQFPFSFAVFGRKYVSRKIPVPGNLLSIYIEADKRIDSCQSSADTLEVARWIVDQIGKQDSKPNKPREAQGGAQGDAQGEAQGDAQEGDQEAQGDAKEGAQEAPDAGQSKPLNGKHDTAVEVEPGLPARPGDRGTFCRGNSVLPDRIHTPTWASYRLEDSDVPAALRVDIRKLFANTANDDWQMHRKTGSIDTRQLATGGASMFKRRLETSGVDSSVVILLDVSGSMFPRLIGPAAGACMALMSALDGAGVESALLTFGDGVSTVKPFGKNSRQTKQHLQHINMGGGTDDYVALLHAHSLLHTRKTGRKVCFVVTDGEGRVSETRAQAKIGANLGITTIGIGIDKDVSYIYKHAVMVRKVSDLGAAMFSKIKGVL